MVDKERRLWEEEKLPMHVYGDGHRMESAMAYLRDVDRSHP